MPTLRHALRLLVTATLAAAVAGAAPPPIETCREVRALPREEAGKALPVLVRGVVTFVHSAQSAVIQDDTEAVYVSWSKLGETTDAKTVVLVGRQVEVSGVTGPGGYAPVVYASSIKLLGEGAIPPFPRVSISELRSGRYDCQQVEVTGVVQRSFPGNESGVETRLEVANPGAGFSVYINKSQGLDAAQLVDAELRFQGVCFTLFTPRGELVGVTLRLTSASQMTVLKPAPPAPFDVPAAPPYALRPYQHDGPSLHRQRISGTVTLCRPGEFFYLQMKERGVRVNTRSPEALTPGEQVEASGFVEHARAVAALTEAVFRRTGRGPLPAPLPVRREDILSVPSPRADALRQEDYDGSLITLRGHLLKVESSPNEDHRLYLDCDGGVIIASAPASTPAEDWRRLEPGSLLEATGICSVTLSSTWPAHSLPVPEDFSLILQSPDSVHVLAVPSWWTAARLRQLLAATGTLLAVALGAVLLLRRTVAQRTAQLAREMQARQEQERARHDAEVEFSATLRERERLAADLHDTLEQTLTGVAMQLDATQRAPSQERAGRNLSMAVHMLALSREDVRRSVWNLRAQALDGQFLREALTHIAGSLLEGSGIALSVGGTGEEQALPDLIEGNLLMLAKEALTNSLKHARPTRLDITIDYAPRSVTLSVADDGCGFSPDLVPGPHDGHFGLTGMKERAARLSARVDISSTPGCGTKITITVPVEPA